MMVDLTLPVLCVLFNYISATTFKMDKHSRQDESFGKIKEFDDMLMMYGKEINEGKNLNYALQEAKKLSQDPSLYHEFTSYYIEILELLKSTGSSKIISQEHERLNMILTSASYQPDGRGEMDYALVRRNILGSFIEAAAQFVMNSMMMDSPGMDGRGRAGFKNLGPDTLNDGRNKFRKGSRKIGDEI